MHLSTFSKKATLIFFLSLVACGPSRAQLAVEQASQIGTQLGLTEENKFHESYQCSGLFGDFCWAFIFYTTDKTSEALDEIVRGTGMDTSPKASTTQQTLYTLVNHNEPSPILTSSGKDVNGNRQLGENTDAFEWILNGSNDERFTVAHYRLGGLPLEFRGVSIDKDIVVIGYKDH